MRKCYDRAFKGLTNNLIACFTRTPSSGVKLIGNSETPLEEVDLWTSLEEHTMTPPSGDEIHHPPCHGAIVEGPTQLSALPQGPNPFWSGTTLPQGPL